MIDVFIGYFPDPEKPTELPESAKQFAAECDKAGVSYCMPALPIPVKGSPEYSGYCKALGERLSECWQCCMIVGRNADKSYPIWNMIAINKRLTFLTLPEALSEKFRKTFKDCMAKRRVLYMPVDSIDYPKTPGEWADLLHSIKSSFPVMDFRGEWLTIQGTRQDILAAILSGCPRRDILEVPYGYRYASDEIPDRERLEYTPASDREAVILRRYANTLCDLMLQKNAWLPRRKLTFGQTMPPKEEYCACLIQSPFPYSDYYYINMRKFTYIVLSVLATCALSQFIGEIPAGIMTGLWACQFPEADRAILKKLDSDSGAVCLLKEALTEKKNGIDKNYLSKFRGECANNNIPCQFRHDIDKCGCGPAQVETICDQLVEDRILGKKGDRYYY